MYYLSVAGHSFAEIAPCHKAAQTCNFLKSNGSLTFPWPSQSPDLNIENVWHHMKNMIRKDPSKNKQQLVKKFLRYGQSFHAN